MSWKPVSRSSPSAGVTILVEKSDDGTFRATLVEGLSDVATGEYEAKCRLCERIEKVAHNLREKL